MTENMTVCPDCGTEFETVEQKQELPSQLLEQSCPECGYDVTVGILNYPDSTYEVIAPSIGDDEACVECGDPPTHRVQKVGHPVEPHCIEHIGLHRQAVFNQ